MVKTKQGKIIKSIMEITRKNEDFKTLYTTIKNKENDNKIVANGLGKLFAFFQSYTGNTNIWSYEIVSEFLKTPWKIEWITAIREVFPQIEDSLHEKTAQITGIALLDFLILDKNLWLIDDLSSDYINEPILHKRYSKQ